MMIELTIKSAETKRKENEIYKFNEEKRRQEYEINRPLRVADLLPRLFNKVKKEIEKETCFNSCCIDLYHTEIKKWNCYDFKDLEETIDLVIKLLAEAGYECYSNTYSKAWQTRSDKYGYIHVNWYE